MYLFRSSFSLESYRSLDFYAQLNCNRFGKHEGGFNGGDSLINFVADINYGIAGIMSALSTLLFAHCKPIPINNPTSANERFFLVHWSESKYFTIRAPRIFTRRCRPLWIPNGVYHRRASLRQAKTRTWSKYLLRARLISLMFRGSRRLSFYQPNALNGSRLDHKGGRERFEKWRAL